ncbi:hypothetical protein PAXRUDRAFT_134525 [Paxillus rubicundulus Ve08.2h10]|uniref:Uncharacterized protein n=1 Tax=Paxillus rubicundulus Ve08.2h10 TaxID=930991 RepID=A0A0D0EBV7_9AGAM|nr:hypothetical protein PAXRUDRAFT_134525 [Paxillus rubicundulus Ve08.2h10]
MDSVRSTRGVCASCVYNVPSWTLRPAVPDPALLNLLVNLTSPAHTLPVSYNLALYCNAISSPKGMESAMSLAPILLCPHCCSTLLAQKPHQPKNSLANFQYYGHKRLGEATSKGFNGASPFELALILCTGTSMVTFHYNPQSSWAGYTPEETHQ